MKLRPPFQGPFTNLKRYIGRVGRAYKQSLLLDRFWEHLGWRKNGQEFVGGEINFRSRRRVLRQLVI